MAEKHAMGRIEAVAREFYGAAAFVPRDVGMLTVEELLVRPAAGRNHIYWLFGHIVAGAEVAPFICGMASVVSNEYQVLFGRGTVPKDDAAGYPPITRMTALFDTVVDNSLRAIRSLNETDLELPPTGTLPTDIAEYFQTRQDIISDFAHHMVYHAGQIATIMKMLGK